MHKKLFLLLLIIITNLIFVSCDDCPSNPNKENVIYDIDGNEYRIVKIGDQWWMAENLRVSRYRNGDSIPYYGISVYDLPEEFCGAWCYYEHNAEYERTYGKLYTGYTVDDSRGLAPDGWHVASEDEWRIMEIELGMSEWQASQANSRGNNEGSKLAGEYYLWENDTLINNPEFDITGFKAIPGGMRSNQNPFGGIGSRGGFWSSTSFGQHQAYMRFISYNYPGLYRNYKPKGDCYSIRCVKD
jgi:uncharacterized protein (TIGR02145 family)